MFFTLHTYTIRTFQSCSATIDLYNSCPVFLFLCAYCCRAYLEKRREFILLIPQLCPCATTNVSIVIVSLRGLQREAKQQWAGFMDSSLHLVINHKGSIVAVKITPANVDERTLLDEMTQNLKGSLFADKGFISRDLFKKLFQRGLKLITGIRRNMKNYLMPLIEKILLRKRFLIETIFDILKVHMNLSHTRHRSPTNCCVNILSCLVAYQLRENKPNIKFSNLLIQN